MLIGKIPTKGRGSQNPDLLLQSSVSTFDGHSTITEQNHANLLNSSAKLFLLQHNYHLQDFSLMQLQNV